MTWSHERCWANGPNSRSLSFSAVELSGLSETTYHKLLVYSKCSFGRFKISYHLKRACMFQAFRRTHPRYHLSRVLLLHLVMGILNPEGMSNSELTLKHLDSKAYVLSPKFGNIFGAISTSPGSCIDIKIESVWNNAQIQYSLMRRKPKVHMHITKHHYVIGRLSLRGSSMKDPVVFSVLSLILKADSTNIANPRGSQIELWRQTGNPRKLCKLSKIQKPSLFLGNTSFNKSIVLVCAQVISSSAVLSSFQWCFSVSQGVLQERRCLEVCWTYP